MSVDETQTVVGSAAAADPVRALIVEDNPQLVETYRYVLTRLAAGERWAHGPVLTEVAHDGAEALERVRGQSFDLLLTDLFLPVLDGFELVRQMRADPRLQRVAIVAIAAGGPEDRQRALAVGADVFLRKPVRFADMLDTVKQLLRSR